MASKTSESPLKPTVIFVPFFGGTAPALRRHFEFIESLGLKWKFVDLPFESLEFFKNPVAAQKFRFGLKSIWADKIEDCLNQTPGPKIIFSFSTPTSGAIEAIARRFAHDIYGLISDGGPSGELTRSIFSYYKAQGKLPSPLLPLVSLGSAYMIDLHQKTFCQKDLCQFPAEFPILSIRGWKDEIITPRQIDLIFSTHPQLRWQKLAIPEGGHLNGLRDFPNIYMPGVERFLSSLTARHIS